MNKTEVADMNVFIDALIILFFILMKNCVYPEQVLRGKPVSNSKS